ELYRGCNPDQRGFIDLVRDRLQHLATSRGREPTNLILLKGEGGTGKTHALNVLIELLNAAGTPIRACASTGIAATRLLGGTTAHSLFSIPVDKDDAPRQEIKFSTVDPNSLKGNILRRIAVFVIDEVGMLNVDDLYCINMLLKDLHNSSHRYGRVLMIFSGDE